MLGPDRASLLAASYPATRAADTARKNRETARLNKRLKMIDAFEDAHTAELEALITAASQPAITALRTRHIQRFTELEAERADISSKLAARPASSPAAPSGSSSSSTTRSTSRPSTTRKTTRSPSALPSPRQHPAPYSPSSPTAPPAPPPRPPAAPPPLRT